MPARNGWCPTSKTSTKSSVMAMTEKDKALVEKARHQRWEDIDEDAADTEEGRRALHDIAIRKYHYDEYKAGML